MLLATKMRLTFTPECGHRYPSFTEISRAADFITGTSACIRS
ncbi:hypothetical protein [Brevibacterium aurantiacum]|uniref:Uncharacterized protein n=1 Tax=Brevibacterium aurantiacum TaxID=273384 RepID=A0A2H1JRS4_BREAU|nr:hypothetical protein [Brevibacterium aurantiacum]SMX90159.1 hypothetical protein BAURA63_02565 [Brevibacterium aurantiacum]